MSEGYDVVVVGAGIAGTTSAYYLAKRGARVLVLEKGEVAGEQSSRNWGFVRQQGRDPAEIPLMMQSNEIWRGLERELNADLEWFQGGNLITFADERERRGWEKWLETARGFGLDSRLLERAEIDEVVPGNGFECLGAVFTESDGQAEPRKVTAAFRRAARGPGRRISHPMRRLRNSDRGRRGLRRRQRAGGVPRARRGLRRRDLVQPTVARPRPEAAAGLDPGLGRADDAGATAEPPPPCGPASATASAATAR